MLLALALLPDLLYGAPLFTGSPDDYYASAVALDGDTLVVGGRGDDGVEIYRFVAGVPMLEDVLDVGAVKGGQGIQLRGDTLVFGDGSGGGPVVRTYERTGTVWSETQILSPTTSADQVNDWGRYVSFTEDWGLVSAIGLVPGTTRHFQAIYREIAFGSCAQEQNTTQGVTVTIQP